MAVPPPRWALLLPALVASALATARRPFSSPADSQCFIQVQLQVAGQNAKGEKVVSDSAEVLGTGSSTYYKTLSLVGAAQAVLAGVPKAQLAALPAATSAALDHGLLEVQDRLEALLLLLPAETRARAIRQAAAPAPARHPSPTVQGTQPWVLPAEQCRAGGSVESSASSTSTAACTRPAYSSPLWPEAPAEGQGQRLELDALVARLARREDSASRAGTPQGVGAKTAPLRLWQVRNDTDWSSSVPDTGDVQTGVRETEVPAQASTAAENPLLNMTAAHASIEATPARWLFWTNLALVLLAFVLIVLVVVFCSPIRGAMGVVGDSQGHLQVQGRSSNKFIQVLLPFWLPVEQDSQGWLWLWLFAATVATAISAAWLWAIAIVRLALTCDPMIFASFGQSGTMSLFHSRVLFGVCIGGLFALPVNYLIFYRKLKGREPQWCILTAQLFLMFQGTFTGFVATFINRNTTNWIVGHNQDAFWHWQRSYVAITTFIGLCFGVLSTFVGVWLQWRWKRFMTNYVLDRYLANRAFYHLNSNSNKEDGSDNPDARICNDVPAVIYQITDFVFSMLGLIQGLIMSMLIIWTCVPYWTMIAVVYCLAGSVVSMWFSWRFLKLNYEVEKKGADFRFSLFNVRTMAEPIALLAGERCEHAKIVNRFEAVQEFNMRSIQWNVGFGLYEALYSMALNLAPPLLLTRRYFRGHLDFGGIGQIVSAFGSLTEHLNYISDHSHHLAGLGNSITRIAGLLRRIEELEGKSQIEVDFTDQLKLDLNDVAVYTPMSKQPIVSGLNLSVGGDSGFRRLLICGRSGIGKTTLLRGVAGLWLDGKGSIVRPRDEDCMFLPQQPYMPIGNLRDQFRYPVLLGLEDPWESGGASPTKDSEHSRKARNEDKELMPLLKDLGLGDLPGRFEDGFDQNEDWKRFLSTGEQQRVAAIRCLLKRPKLAILDECTSALSEQDELLVYRLLRKQNLSYISVGHRQSLLAFHDRVLLIRSSTEHLLLTPEEYLALQKKDIEETDNTTRGGPDSGNENGY